MENRGEPLKPHPRIDRRAGERGQDAGIVPVVLHEDEIPDLEISVAVAPHGTGRPATGKGRALIHKDLRAWTAGPGVSHLPEIVLFSESNDSGGIDTRNALPKGGRFVIVGKDRHPEDRRRQAQRLRQILPGKGDGLLFEVIPEGEIPHHLEEGVMAPGKPHPIEIVVLPARPHTSLDRDASWSRRRLRPEKGILEGHHAGIGKEKGWIARRDQ